MILPLVHARVLDELGENPDPAETIINMYECDKYGHFLFRLKTS